MAWVQLSRYGPAPHIFHQTNPLNATMPSTTTAVPTRLSNSLPVVMRYIIIIG